MLITTMDLIKSTQAYLNYIYEHWDNVQRAWGEFQNKCADEPIVRDRRCWEILNREILQHDMSKLSAEEFTQYRDYFYPCPIRSVDVEKRFVSAWKNHYRKNSHHWEAWSPEYMMRIAGSISDSGLKVPGGDYQLLAYAMMVIDWTAMGYKFGDTALEYYEKHKEEIYIPEPRRAFVERLLRAMAKNECETHIERVGTDMIRTMLCEHCPFGGRLTDGLGNACSQCDAKVRECWSEVPSTQQDAYVAELVAKAKEEV